MNLDDIIKELQEIRDKNKTGEIPVVAYDLGESKRKSIGNIYETDGQVEIWID